MAEHFLTCPLCGFEFQKSDALCHHGCPLGAMCHLARCPSCEYEFPEQLPSGSWLRRLWRRERAAQPLPMKDLEELMTVRKMAAGERAEVLCLAGESHSRRNHLAVFGLVPGSEIRLLQRIPSFVVEIGETILALDADVAGDIVVKRPSHGDGGVPAPV